MCILRVVCEERAETWLEYVYDRAIRLLAVAALFSTHAAVEDERNSVQFCIVEHI